VNSDQVCMCMAVQMEGMVSDLQLARDMQQRFEEWRSEQAASGAAAAAAPAGCDISVSVLTTGFWPSYKVVDMDLPKEMVESQAQFKVRAADPSRSLPPQTTKPARTSTSPRHNRLPGSTL